MKIAALGPAGTFSHQAARIFRPDAEIVFYDTISDCFESLEKKEADMSCVPLENSIDGSIGETLDLMLEHSAFITESLALKIAHNLIGSSIASIRRLYVQPKTYAQCRKYIRDRFRNTQIIYTPSNAASAKSIEGPEEGAIAPESAAELYSIPILEKHIEDYPQNTTEFILITKKPEKTTQKSRTMIALACKDRPGALYGILSHFSLRSINLKKIESRPSKKRIGEYIFYICLEGSRDDQAIKETLEKVKTDSQFLNVLGSYDIKDHTGDAE